MTFLSRAVQTCLPRFSFSASRVNKRDTSQLLGSRAGLSFAVINSYAPRRAASLPSSVSVSVEAPASAMLRSSHLLQPELTSPSSRLVADCREGLRPPIFCIVRGTMMCCSEVSYNRSSSSCTSRCGARTAENTNLSCASPASWTAMSMLLACVAAERVRQQRSTPRTAQIQHRGHTQALGASTAAQCRRLDAGCQALLARRASARRNRD